MDVTTTYYSVLRKKGKNRKNFWGRNNTQTLSYPASFHLAADLNLASEMKVLRFGGGSNLNNENMISEFLQYLFGEPCASPNRKDIATPSDSNKSVANTIDEDEIVKLARLYGPLASGKRIELTLQEALKEFPRERKRSDAYKSLINKVKQEYGTDLIISGRKEKK